MKLIETLIISMLEHLVANLVSARSRIALTRGGGQPKCGGRTTYYLGKFSLKTT